MRFMVFVKSSKEADSGGMPDKKDLIEMGKFNEQLVEAGLMRAGEGLRPGKEGTRIQFADGKPTVRKGPFDHPEEQVAGFWQLNAKSLDEVIEWMKKAPFKDGELEIRQVMEDEEFSFAPEVVEQEKRLRAKIAQRQPS